MFKLQKLAIRNIAGLTKRTSCRAYFRSLRILTLTAIYILEIAMYVKINLASFEINSNFHLYDTRNRDALCFPVHDLSTFERSPVYMGIKIYNNLPIFIRAISSVSGFKSNF